MVQKVPQPATLAQLQKSRTLVARGPSGHAYRIRPMNMERYALAGGLPTSLRKLALQGADGIDAVLTATDEELAERGESVREYMDNVVRQLVVEPDLADADLDVLPPVDYRWLVQVALGEDDRDGEGRRLWGREPLTVWSSFREVHGCAEDCARCEELRSGVADLQQR